MNGAPSNCVKCPRLCTARTQPVNGQGRKGGIMVVASTPGYYDDRDNEPLLGRQGKLFRLVCDEAGLPRNVVFKTYAVRCFTDGIKPKKNEIANCREYLLREIDAVQPIVIITLGAEALNSLYGTGAIRDYTTELALWEMEIEQLVDTYQTELALWAATPRGKGRPLKPKKPKSPRKPKKPKDENVAIGSVAGHTLIQVDTGIPLIPTYAPNFLMRGKWDYTDIVIAHFKKAMRIYTGEQGIPVA